MGNSLSEDVPSNFLSVLQYCSWNERGILMCLNKTYHAYTSSDRYYHWCSQRLSIENGIYFPTQLPSPNGGQGLQWKVLFIELWPLRNMWFDMTTPAQSPGLMNIKVDSNDNHALDKEDNTRFKINVYARFRPKPDKTNSKSLLKPEELTEDGKSNSPTSTATGIGEGEEEGVEVSLPLYQRLALIKLKMEGGKEKEKENILLNQEKSENRKNDKRTSRISNRQALRVLAQEGGWFMKKWNSNSTNEADSECQKKSGQMMWSVGFDDIDNTPKAFRSHSQDKSTVSNVIEVNGDGEASTNRIIASVQNVDQSSGKVVMIAQDVGLREFQFNGVLPDTSSQTAVYNTVAQRLVIDFINGYNATAVVYGQTGSGKSYSMFGSDDSYNAPPPVPSTSSFSASNFPKPFPSNNSIQARLNHRTSKAASKSIPQNLKFNPCSGLNDNVIIGKEMGLVPRACMEVFAAAERRKKEFGIHYELAVSYVEVFGDYVSDLLNNGARCGQSQVASQRYVLSGAAEHVITSMYGTGTPDEDMDDGQSGNNFEEINENVEKRNIYEKDWERELASREWRSERVGNIDSVMGVLREGEKMKRRAVTAMNEKSSRAHVLFILTLRQSYDGHHHHAANNSIATATPITKTSRLFLVDLGGSEQVKKSEVEAGQHRLGLEDHFSAGFEKAANMREAVFINLGLLALKKVIESLNRRAPHIPYHDSKLTLLLRDGLGGNSKTSVIVTAAMDSKHASETVSSLRFGERCAVIENTVNNSNSFLENVLAELDKKIRLLESEIKRKERWEVREEIRVDELAEEGTFEAMQGKEVKKVYVVAGAEEERSQLEVLLRQRAKFTGTKLFDDDDGDDETEEDLSHTVSVKKERSVVRKKAKGSAFGFGDSAKVYGLGERYNYEKEMGVDNSRFNEVVDEDELPEVIRRAAGGCVVNVDGDQSQSQSKKAKKPMRTQWTTSAELMSVDSKVLEEKAKRVKRNKLVFSGLSL